MDILNSQPTKTKQAREQIVGVEYGNDLQRVIFSELGTLADPNTEDVFFRKFIDKELMQYEMGGKEPVGRGPIVILIDESGSMSGARNELARAICVAMVQIARKENRKISVIGFNARITTIHSFHSGICQLGIRGNDCEQIDYGNAITDLATRFAGGGTKFDPAIKKALDSGVEEDRADLIMLTDGCANIDVNVLSRLDKAKENGLRVFSILFNSHLTESIKKLSTQVISLKEMTIEAAEEGCANIMHEAKKK